MQAISILEEAQENKERRSIASKQRIANTNKKEKEKKENEKNEGNFFSNFFKVFKCGQNGQNQAYEYYINTYRSLIV